MSDVCLTRLKRGRSNRNGLYSLAQTARSPARPRARLDVMVLKSKCWLVTSPHKEYTHEELCNLMRWIHNPESPMYDYCLATEHTEDVPHMHLAIRFASEHVNFWPTIPLFAGWNVQVVPENRWDLALDYVKKSGQYYHLHEVLPELYANPLPVWRPWQQRVLDSASDPRKIICVVDDKGNTGKTFLAMWHAVRYRAVILPLLKSYNDMMRMVYSQPASMYFIDVPRALSKRQLREVYAAAETVKNGYAYDDRYQFKRRFFDSPKIVIYTNKMPDVDYLSADRWVYIYPDYKYI